MGSSVGHSTRVQFVTGERLSRHHGLVTQMPQEVTGPRSYRSDLIGPISLLASQTLKFISFH